MEEGLDALLVLCRGCECLEDCVGKLLPILRCQYSSPASVDDHVNALGNVAPREPEHLGVIATPVTDSELVVRMISILAARTPSSKLILYVPWDLFTDLVAYEDRVKVLRHAYRVYVHVQSAKTMALASKIVRSKAVSRYKDVVVLMYYAASPSDVEEAIKWYQWRGAPHFCVLLPREPDEALRRVMERHGFRRVEEKQFMNFTVEGFLDSSLERFVEVMQVMREPASSALLVVHSGGVKVLRGRMHSRAARRALLSILCRAAWRVSLEAVVDGVAVVNPELVEIVKALMRSPTLRSATSMLKISYPTMRGRISLAEKVLGVKLVNVQRGGVIRGKAAPTMEAEKLVEIYERIRRKLEEKLQELLADVCRELE